MFAELPGEGVELNEIFTRLTELENQQNNQQQVSDLSIGTGRTSLESFAAVNTGLTQLFAVDPLDQEITKLLTPAGEIPALHTNAIVSHPTDDPLNLFFLEDPQHDGQIKILHPENGKDLILKTGGHFANSADITVQDGFFTMMLWSTENGNKWLPLQTAAGGGDNLGNHTATQALKMKDFAIFLDTAENQSIIALALANNYVVPVGGAHDFFVNNLITPKFGITETSIESNVRLDMNDQQITNTAAILPNTDAIYDLGSDLLSYDTLFIGLINLADAQSAPNSSSKNSIRSTATTISFNLDNAVHSYQFYWNGVANFALGQTSITTALNFILGDGSTGGILTLNNAAVDPSSNGQITKNVNDVKVFTGGAVVNFSDIANKTLSNLTSPTDINQALIPDATNTFDFGSELKAWRIGHFREIEFVTDASVPSGLTDTQISKNASGNLAFNNAAAGGGFLFYFQGVNNWSMTPTTLTGPNAIITGSFNLNDSVTNPTLNGEFRRNGNDVKVFTGGVLKNLTDIGTGGGGANTALSNLASVAINTALLPNSDGALNLGSAAFAWNDVFTERLRIEVGGSVTNSANTIIADAGGMILNTPSGDRFEFNINGQPVGIAIDDGEMQFLQSGRQHKLSATATSLQVIAENETDTVEIWTGAGRTNATVQFSDTTTTWLTETDDTQAILLQLIQNHDIPADFRTLANIDFMAENSVSVNQIYGRISVSSQDVTDATEDGLMQLGIMSAGTLVSAMDIEGGTSVSTGAKIAFYGGTPVARQTGVAVSAAGIHAALVNLNLITA